MMNCCFPGVRPEPRAHQRCQLWSVYVPLVPDTSAEENLKRVRILLADDHADFLAVTTRLLEPEFEVVKTVCDGQATIDEIAKLEPEVLVLDISMPVLNGIAVARQLRASGSKVKIVFVTVHEDADYVRAGLAVGAQGYVVKSRLSTDLPRALKEALAGRFFVSPCVHLD
jgi:DNA-binding NarL/FixJ family response regulator